MGIVAHAKVPVDVVLTACTGCDPPPGEVTRGCPGLAEPVWAILVDSICTPHRLFIPPPLNLLLEYGVVSGVTPQIAPHILQDS